jgi:hypothetical protein
MQELPVPSHGRCRISVIRSEGMSGEGPYGKNLRRMQVSRRERAAWSYQP